jgi:hypothetical protein
MKSKIYNLRNLAYAPIVNDFLTDYNSQYQNRITGILAMNKSFIQNGTSYTIDTNYPLDNVFDDYSMYSFTRCNTVHVPSYGFHSSGFRFTGTSGNITDGFFQFNKEGSLLSTNWDGSIHIYIRHKTDNTKYFGFRYLKTSAAVSIFDAYEASGSDVDGVFYAILDISNCLSLKEGFFYFNQEHLKQLGLIRQALGYPAMSFESFSFADYDVTIELNTTTAVKMELSNCYLGKAYEFYANGAINFDNNNLNKYEATARNGRTFQQTNKRLKTMAFNLNPLNANKVNEFIESVGEYNKDFPFFFLPYANEELGEAVDGYRCHPYATWEQIQKDFQIRNLNQGGLYYFEEIDKLTNSKYNVFSIDVKLKEYK